MTCITEIHLASEPITKISHDDPFRRIEGVYVTKICKNENKKNIQFKLTLSTGHQQVLPCDKFLRELRF